MVIYGVTLLKSRKISRLCSRSFFLLLSFVRGCKPIELQVFNGLTTTYKNRLHLSEEYNLHPQKTCQNDNRDISVKIISDILN